MLRGPAEARRKRHAGEAIRAGLDSEFDKFTIWPDEEGARRAA